jgi:hypothetical protein
MTRPHLPLPRSAVRRGAVGRGAAAAAVAGLALAAASCSSGGSGPAHSAEAPPDTRLTEAGTTVVKQIGAYRVTARHCAANASPVVCVEAADRTLGGQVHTYANLLAVGRDFTATTADLSAARNSAQTVANSLEILGDAQPTQANYNQVLNTFDLSAALGQLQAAVGTLDSHLRR